MQIQMMKLSEIHPYEKNPRFNDGAIEAVANSIKEFGFQQPIVIDKDNVVVAGHTRLRGAKKLGLTEVPCIIASDLTPEQVQAYRIADNKTGEIAEWNYDLLPVEIKELQEKDFDLSLLGFDADELDKFLNGGTEENTIAEGETDADAVPEVPEKSVSKHGEIYQLGKHRLMCGDSTKAECYDTLMDGVKANLVLSDPPYNVDVEETAGKIMNDNMGDSEFYEFLLAAFKQMHGHLADDGSIYIFHADTEGLNFRKAFKDAGFYLSGCCIWKKNALVLGRSPYQWQHEPCLYGWKLKGKHQWYSDRKQTTIWEFDKPKKNGDHPTMKPIPLIAYPIKNSSMSNCIVLDPFGGSGSTLIACEQTNRICHTVELDEKFCDVIVKRYIEQVGSAENVSVVRDGKTIAYSELEVTDEE